VSYFGSNVKMAFVWYKIADLFPCLHTVSMWVILMLCLNYWPGQCYC